jgi:hypothetical protein
LEVRACEDLARWAAKKGQTPPRVLEALRTVEKQWRIPPLYSDVIKQNYIRHLQYLQSDWMYHRGEWAVMWRLPWERARVWRLLNQLTAEELAESQANEAVLASGGAVGIRDAGARPTDDKTVRVPKRDITYQLVQFVQPMVRPSVFVPVNGREVDIGNLSFCLKVETYRRATRLILALEAWKLDHGGLPESLGDLKGKYLDQLPVDPYTGGAFRYEPKGLACCVAWHPPDFGAMKSLEPRQPFLACDSWASKGYEEFFNSEPRPPEPPQASTATPAPITEWKGVWVFPIP